MYDFVEIAQIFDSLKQKFGDAVLSVDSSVKSPFITVAPDSLVVIMRFLRDDPAMKFDMLLMISGVDYPTCFASVTHLTSLTHKHTLAVKVELPREAPEVDSLVDIWPAADWHERETYDMMGIEYRGHPQLRRILCPEDWEGFPLRKNYRQPEEYHGISNVRQIGDDYYPKPDEDEKAVQGWKAPKPPPAPKAAPAAAEPATTAVAKDDPKATPPSPGGETPEA